MDKSLAESLKTENEKKTTVPGTMDGVGWMGGGRSMDRLQSNKARKGKEVTYRVERHGELKGEEWRKLKKREEEIEENRGRKRVAETRTKVV